MIGRRFDLGTKPPQANGVKVYRNERVTDQVQPHTAPSPARASIQGSHGQAMCLHGHLASSDTLSAVAGLFPCVSALSADTVTWSGASSVRGAEASSEHRFSDPEKLAR